MIGHLSESYVKQRYWQIAEDDKGVLANTLSVEQALLGASALDHASVEALADANKVLINLPNGTPAVELRFVSVGTENLDDILQLYMASSTDSITDHYRHFAQLTITLGTQVYTPTQEFHDTVVAANAEWLTTANDVSPANNTFGSYVFNTHGNNKLLVIASDLDNTSIDVHWRRL